MAEDAPWLHAEPVGLPQGKQRQRDQQTGRNKEFTQKNLKRKSSVQYAGVFKKKSLYYDAFITQCWHALRLGWKGMTRSEIYETSEDCTSLRAACSALGEVHGHSWHSWHSESSDSVRSQHLRLWDSQRRFQLSHSWGQAWRPAKTSLAKSCSRKMRQIRDFIIFYDLLCTADAIHPVCKHLQTTR